MSAMPSPFLCVLLLATLVGCSRTELVYSNADWLLQRWAAGLLDPESEQRDAWQVVMKQAMQVHRRDLLPDVVRILRTAEAAAADGLNRGELGCWAGLVEQAYLTHAHWAIGPAAEVLSDVSSAQIEHLAEQLRERNQEYRDEYLDQNLAERRQARVARYAERIEYWAGDLSAAQQRLLEEAVSAMPDVAEGWLEYREERQHKLLGLLRAGADRAALETFLTAWWVDLDGRPAALVEDSQALGRATLELVLRLDATLSVEQRAAFLAKLADLREDFERLTGEHEGLPPAPDAELACTDTPQRASL